MKLKYLCFALACTCLAGIAFSSNTASENGIIREAAYDDVVGINKINALETKNAVIGDDTIAVSKTYAQYGVIDGKDSLRFVTAVKGDIASISYTRSALGLEEKTVEVTTLYQAIKGDGDNYYYDGTSLTTDATYAGQYYWALYTIQFDSDTYKATDFSSYVTVTDSSGNETKSTLRHISSSTLKNNAPYEVNVFYPDGGAWLTFDILWNDAAYAITSHDSVDMEITVGTSVIQDNTGVNWSSPLTNGIHIARSFASAAFNSSTVSSLKMTLFNDAGDKYEITLDFLGQYSQEKANTILPSANLDVQHLEVSRYTVSFDGNYDGAPSIEPIVVTNDLTYGTLPELTRDGYMFDGWYTDPTEGTVVTSATKVALTQDITLYAHWIDQADYRVSVFGGGGAWVKFQLNWLEDTKQLKAINKDNIDVTLKVKSSGATISFSRFIDDQVIDTTAKTATMGMSFAGAEFRNFVCSWEVQITNVSDEIYSIKFDTTPANDVFAVSGLDVTKLEITKYMVSFDANCTDVTSPDSKEVIVGAKYGTLPDLEREGYALLGWFTDPTEGTQITKDSIVEIDQDTTLYAHWKEGYVGKAISTLAELKAYFDGGAASNAVDAYLANNIDCEGWSINMGMAGEFKAKFNGAGHTISNITINQALFNIIGSTGSVSNLNLTCTYTGTGGYGALAYANNGVISKVNVDVTLDTNLGGTPNAPFAQAGNGTIKDSNAIVRYVADKVVMNYFAIQAGAGATVENCTCTYYNLAESVGSNAPSPGPYNGSVVVTNGDL